MGEAICDEETVALVVTNLLAQQLPRVLEIREAIDSGDVPREADISCLRQVLDDVDHADRVVGPHHPDVQALYLFAMNLDEEVMAARPGSLS